MKKNGLISILIFSLVTLTVLGVSFIKTVREGRLKIVFCDVGQGDGIYIRFPQGQDMLIDGGVDSRILSCLGEHMAFWDRTIEIVLLTHPQHDHYNGLTEVISRYRVNMILAPPVENEAKSYQRFKEVVHERAIKVNNIYQGDKLIIPGLYSRSDVQISVLWPEREWVTDRMEPGKESNILLNVERLDMKSYHDNLNDFSIVLNISYGLFDVLMTGDAESEIIEKLTDSGKIPSNDIEVIKIGHHGAKAGLNQTIAEYIKPDLAVISVGKNNRYGHPSEEVIMILDSLDISVARTDRDGTIEITTDGKHWRVN